MGDTGTVAAVWHNVVLNSGVVFQRWVRKFLE